ncbi:MAG: glycosyltransferase 87 family protein [Terracidiphilus sp.]
MKILQAIVTLPTVTVCALASGFTAGVLCVALLSPLAPATRDYILYWATAQQLVHHANPYDVAVITQLERTAGLPSAFKVGYTRNPPWALPLIYPLGFLSPRAGWILWYLLLLVSLTGSVYLLWILFGRPRNSRYLLGLTFAPALVCMVFGQTALLVLPGLVLFLRWHNTRPFLAGLSLWLCALKPHLFLPFGVVLLAWIAVSRACKLAAGAMAAIAASCALTYLMAPHAWTQYAQMAHASGIESEQVPCLSSQLRHWLSPQATWLQYLPAAIGCAWALAFFWPRRHAWDWLKHGSYLLLVSLVVAPYSWIFDHGMVLPALLRSVYLTHSRSLLIALASLSALVEIALFCSLFYPPAMYLWTIWAAPAWLVWVLIADAPTEGWIIPFWSVRARRDGQAANTQQELLRGVPMAERLG